jgi:hypothetical protein
MNHRTLQSNGDDGKKRRTNPWSRNRVSEEFAKFFDRFEWDHTICLTFKGRLGEETARKMVENWLRHLNQMAQRRVGYAVSRERGAGGRIHFHVVIEGTQKLRKREVARSWRHGIASVAKFDRAQGGLSYLTKDLGREDSELLVSKQLRLRTDKGGAR